MAGSGAPMYAAPVVTAPGPVPPAKTVEPIAQAPAKNGSIDTILPVSAEGLPGSRGADPLKQHSGAPQFATVGGAPAALADPGASSITDEPSTHEIYDGGSPPLLPESRQ